MFKAINGRAAADHKRLSDSSLYLGTVPFTERNAGSLDLAMGTQNVNSLQTNFGGHMAYTWILPNKYETIRT